MKIIDGRMTIYFLDFRPALQIESLCNHKPFFFLGKTQFTSIKMQEHNVKNDNFIVTPPTIVGLVLLLMISVLFYQEER